MTGSRFHSGTMFLLRLFNIEKLAESSRQAPGISYEQRAFTKACTSVGEVVSRTVNESGESQVRFLDGGYF